MPDPQKLVKVDDNSIVAVPDGISDDAISHAIRYFRATKKKKVPGITTEESEHARQLKPAQPLEETLRPLETPLPEYAERMDKAFARAVGLPEEDPILKQQRLAKEDFDRHYPMLGGMMQGVSNVAEGMLSPLNIGVMIAAPESKILSGIFAAQVAKGAFGNIQEARDAYKASKNPQAYRQLMRWFSPTGDVSDEKFNKAWAEHVQELRFQAGQKTAEAVAGLGIAGVAGTHAVRGTAVHPEVLHQTGPETLEGREKPVPYTPPPVAGQIAAQSVDPTANLGRPVAPEVPPAAPEKPVARPLTVAEIERVKKQAEALNPVKNGKSLIPKLLPTVPGAKPVAAAPEPDIRQKLADTVGVWMKRAAMEQQGQGVLDEMIENKESPAAISDKFWSDTYFKLPGEAQARFQRYLTSLTGMKPGSVLATHPTKPPIIANDWMDIAHGLLGNEPEYLEGAERGYAVLMREANNRFAGAAKAQTGTEAKAKTLPEVRAMAEKLRPESGQPLSVVSGVDFSPVIQDIRGQFPTATGIELGGSFARGDMKPKSDIDIIVQLPPGTDQFTASNALDPLFKKYRDGFNGRTVDFIAHVQGGQSFVGQHTQRLEQGLHAPKKTLWGQPYDETAETNAYLQRVLEAEKQLGITNTSLQRIADLKAAAEQLQLPIPVEPETNLSHETPEQIQARQALHAARAAYSSLKPETVLAYENALENYKLSRAAGMRQFLEQQMGQMETPGDVKDVDELNRMLAITPVTPEAKITRRAPEDIWQIPKREYEGEYHSGMTEEEYAERRGRDKEWEQSALAALSTGRLSPQDAYARENHTNPPAGDFKPLPPVLYHVTTAASDVQKEGLGSRWETSQGSGVGLGGGHDMSISFTTDLETAKAIHSALILGQKVASGEVTLENLIEEAKAGKNAPKPYFDEFKKQMESYFGRFDDVLRGVRRDRQFLGTPPKEGEGWVPTEDSTFVVDRAGNKRYFEWERPLDQKEKEWANYIALQKFLYAREQAGGTMNPLFFTTQFEDLAKIDPENIKILKFSAAPGAMGTQEHALGEWRTYSGKAVNLEGEEQSTKYKYGNTQADIPPDSDAGKALVAARENIDKNDLAGKGIEDDPHITVRYGIDGEDTEGIRSYLEQQGPIQATLGKVESFPVSEHSEGAAPIIVRVESPELHRIEKEIDEHGNFVERSFPDYKPHVTLAYVKPEAAEKYVGMAGVEGKTFTINSVSISKKDGSTESVPLKGVPRFLYHSTSSENRESIQKHGLLRSKSDAFETERERGVPDEQNLGGGIYFSTHPSSSKSSDVWKVDTQGLDLEQDDESQFAGNPEYEGHHWFVHYGGDISPSKITLMPSKAQPERSYAEVQKDIDKAEDELEASGEQVTKLYFPEHAEGKGGLKDAPGWKPMPDHLVKLYQERDAIGSRQLTQSIGDIISNIKTGGVTDDKEIRHILEYYALDPNRTDGASQYLANEYGPMMADEPAKRQLDHAYIALASERNIPMDNEDDLYRDQKTTRDAVAAVRAIRAYFYPTEPLNIKGYLGVTPVEPETNLKYKAADKSQPFYLKSERILNEKMRGPMPAADIQKMLLANSVKLEEMKWTGLDDFLKEKGNAKVTPEELQNFINTHDLQIEEVLHGDQTRYKREELKPLEPAAYHWNIEAPGQVFQILRLEHPTIEDAMDYIVNNKTRSDVYSPEVKFSNWNMPGGKQGSYRELVITLPGNEAGKPLPVTKLPDGFDIGVDYSQPEGQKYHILPPGQVHARPYAGRHATPEAAEADALERFNREEIYKWLKDKEKQQFKTTHWEEQNPIGHIRWNERTGPKGERILHIEEIQSDWHQKGRKGRYVDPQKPFGVLGTGEHFATEAEAKAYAAETGRLPESFVRDERIDRPEGAVPDAPFKKTWQELLLKRAIHYAADNGFDGVSWTPGEEQAERYKLSKQVSKIRYNSDFEGPYAGSLLAYDLEGDPIIREDRVPPEKLADYIGKEAAEKLLVSPKDDYEFHVLKDTDLMVGGEGMRGFYDKIIPDTANKLGKKFGAKVGTVEVRTKAYEFPREVPYLPVTDAMRAAGPESLFNIIYKAPNGDQNQLASARQELASVEAQLNLNPPPLEPIDNRGNPIALDGWKARHKTWLNRAAPLLQQHRTLSNIVNYLANQDIGQVRQLPDGKKVLYLKRPGLRSLHLGFGGKTNVDEYELGGVFIAPEHVEPILNNLSIRRPDFFTDLTSMLIKAQDKNGGITVAAYPVKGESIHEALAKLREELNHGYQKDVVDAYGNHLTPDMFGEMNTDMPQGMRDHLAVNYPHNPDDGSDFNNRKRVIEATAKMLSDAPESFGLSEYEWGAYLFQYFGNLEALHGENALDELVHITTRARHAKEFYFNARGRTKRDAATQGSVGGIQGGGPESLGGVGQEAQRGAPQGAGGEPVQAGTGGLSGEATGEVAERGDTAEHRMLPQEDRGGIAAGPGGGGSAAPSVPKDIRPVKGTGGTTLEAIKKRAAELDPRRVPADVDTLFNLKKISQQEAIDKKMFGPTYHGTTEDVRQKISDEGFKVFEGEAGSGEIRHGYQGEQYGQTGIPPPIHHLGFGVYLTTVKDIGKKFNEGSAKGLKSYYIDAPRVAEINFGSPNTMMKWWIKNGYNPKIAVIDRVLATKIMTDKLKEQYDAVWFKGKGIRRLLDGDQIVVFDPERIHVVDNTLTKSGEIGSKVIRKVDGMKGVLVGVRNIDDKEISERYHHGQPRFLEIKWQKGGKTWNNYDSDVDFEGGPPDTIPATGGKTHRVTPVNPETNLKFKDSDPYRPSYLFPEMAEDPAKKWYSPDYMQPEEGDDRPLEDRLEDADGDKDAIARILAKEDAHPSLAYPSGTLYTIEGKNGSMVVDVTKNHSVTVHDDPLEFVQRADLDDYYPDYEDEYNKEFWENPTELYHATDSDNVSSIMKNGLEMRNKTRGLSNRGTMASVYTVSDPEWGGADSYGDAWLKIDTEAMKMDGDTPYISREPDIVEGELRGSLAHAIGLEDYNYDYEHGMDPETIVINGGIDPKYIHVESASDEVLEKLKKQAAKRDPRITQVDPEMQAVRSKLTYTPEDIARIEPKIMEAVGAQKASSVASGAPDVAVRKGLITPLEAAQYSHAKGFRNDLTGAVESHGRPDKERVGTESPDGSAPSVSWYQQDLQDSGQVNEQSILNDYNDGKPAIVYQSYIPIGDLPEPKLAEEMDREKGDEEGGYGWEDLQMSGRNSRVPPIKIRVKKNGKIEILDGNHRLKFWGENYEFIPAWVIDERKGKIVGLEEEQDRLKQLRDEAKRRDPRIKPVDPEANLSYQASDFDKPFYLKSERAIQQMGKNPLSKQSAMNFLIKNGVGKEEMKWTGLDDLLSGPGQITAQEIIEHQQKNNIEIKEVQHGDEKNRKSLAEASQELFGKPYSELEMWQRHEAYNKAFPEDYEADEPTKYARSNLVTPGGENQRELILTMPNIGENSDTLPWKHMPDGSLEATYSGRNFRIFKEGDHWVASEPNRFSIEAPTIGEAIRDIEHQSYFPKRDLRFKTSHWDEINPLVHVRFNDRNIPGIGRTLFIDEIQSDLHQTGAHEGYIEKREPTKYQDNGLPEGYRLDHRPDAHPAYGEYAVFDKDGKFLFSDNDKDLVVKMGRDYANKYQDEDEGKPPDAPFKGAVEWSGLAVKRMVHWAAEHGYDAIAVTSGEIQDQRNDLSKKVSKIRVYKGRPGTDGGNYNLTAYDLSGRAVYSEWLDSEADIAKVIGKDVARKALETEPDRFGVHELSGVDLKIGGKFHYQLYDQIIPNSLNKIGKKFGTKIENKQISIKPGDTDVSLRNEGTDDDPFWVVRDLSEMGMSDPLGEFTNREEAEAFYKTLGYDTSIHVMPISKEMRESVKAEPFSLFNLKKAQEPPKDTRPESVRKTQDIFDKLKAEAERRNPRIGRIPDMGETEDGYKYIGGDPSVETSWELVH